MGCHSHDSRVTTNSGQRGHKTDGQSVLRVIRTVLDLGLSIPLDRAKLWRGKCGRRGGKLGNEREGEKRMDRRMAVVSRA